MAHQGGFWSRPKPASWEKKHGKLFVVQVKGPNNDWSDHAAYDVHDAHRARNTANGLRKTYEHTPGVKVRIIKRSQ